MKAVLVSIPYEVSIPSIRNVQRMRLTYIVAGLSEKHSKETLVSPNLTFKVLKQQPPKTWYFPQESHAGRMKARQPEGAHGSQGETLSGLNNSSGHLTG